MKSLEIITSVLSAALGSLSNLLLPVLVIAFVVIARILLRQPRRSIGQPSPSLTRRPLRPPVTSPPPVAPPPATPERREPDPVGSYRKQSFILSKAEMTFYGVLQKAAPPNTIVLPQIPLRRVIAADRGAGWQSADNRIARKYVDFVVCDQWTRPLAVVELDDRSHRAEDRQTRDDFLDAALGSAGVPIVHVAAANGYSVETLRDLIERTASIGA